MFLLLNIRLTVCCQVPASHVYHVIPSSVHCASEMSQYGSLDLPVWTRPSPGILEPLRLPSPPPPVSRGNTECQVECLHCPEVFGHPEEQQDLLKHLLTEHKFVIGDVNLIANFPAYVRYWRNKFRENSPAKYCTTMRAAVRTGQFISVFQQVKADICRRRRRGGARVSLPVRRCVGGQGAEETVTDGETGVCLASSGGRKKK